MWNRQREVDAARAALIRAAADEETISHVVPLDAA
jgi:hypothetical protein